MENPTIEAPVETHETDQQEVATAPAEMKEEQKEVPQEEVEEVQP